MPVLQLLLGIPFLLLWLYVGLNVFVIFKLKLSKNAIAEEIVKRQKKRARTIAILMILYIVYAVAVFLINYVVTTKK